MKRGLIVLLFLAVFPCKETIAQNPDTERLKAYKIAFFTRRLDLTSREAEKFWPVYNDYQNQKNLIQQERVSLMKNFVQNESTLSDNQISELGDKLCAVFVQESALAVTFHKKLKDVLPPAKVIRLYQAENQYRVQLLNELRDNKPLRNNLQKGPGKNSY